MYFISPQKPADKFEILQDITITDVHQILHHEPQIKHLFTHNLTNIVDIHQASPHVQALLQICENLTRCHYM